MPVQSGIVIVPGHRRGQSLESVSLLVVGVEELGVASLNG